MPDPRAWARHPALPFLILVVLCVALYGRNLAGSFVSEDFLHLREAAQKPFSESLRENASGPLMGVTFVHFYRPLAQPLFHVQYSLWGVGPFGYRAFQLALHLLNAFLVYRLAARWTERHISAFGVALVFALFPLHLNTVLFVAAFPLLVSATLVLTSFFLYERWRESETVVGVVAPLVSFALALGCYEQAAVLPALLLARELLLSRTGRSLWHLSRRLVPFLGMLLAYFLLRYAALGEILGGYLGIQERLLGGDPLAVGRDVLRGLAHLVVPAYTLAQTEPLGAGVAVVLLLGCLWSLVAKGGGRHAPGGPYVWIFGVVWILVTWAPFSFIEVVPGNGRYWYLTSIGLGLLIVTAARIAANAFSAMRVTIRSEAIVLLLVAAVGVRHSFLLDQYLELQRQAGVTAEGVQRSLADLGTEGVERVFVVGHPAFVVGREGTPVAQIFHWGLSDALEPPFSDKGVIVYPLLELPDAALFPVLEREDLGVVRRWNPETARMEKLLRPPPAVARLESRPTSSRTGLRFEGRPVRDRRLVLVTRGNSSAFSVIAEPAGDGWTEVYPPAEIVCSMKRLYAGGVYAWVEEREPDGRLAAVGRLHEVECPGPQGKP